MTSTTADEFISRRLASLESTSMPLIVKGSNDYRQLGMALLYILKAPHNYITMAKGNRVSTMLVSYLKSCQTESEEISYKEWYKDFSIAMKDASNLPIPNHEREIGELLYLMGEGLQKHYDRVMERCRNESDPIIAGRMLVDLSLTIKITKNMIKVIHIQHRGLQIKAKPMPPK